MKLFLMYLRQRWKLYAVGLAFLSVFIVSFALYHLPLTAVIYPICLCLFCAVILTVIDFLKLKRRHEALCRIKSITDVIVSELPEAKSIEEEDLHEIIRLMGEAHKKYCDFRDREYSDMVDYYTVWAHQIKTPIASMRLNLQNEDTSMSRKLSADLFRIEQYVEMVLTFLRLNSDSTDYVIREYSLDSIVRGAVKKFSHEFIGRGLKLNYEPIDAAVITDEKWLSFVIEQVLSNALKYTEAGEITVSYDNGGLIVSDTGIGISPQDLPRIFENGYTGLNGRIDKRSSGIGLYLCKRICNNLKHMISVDSVVGVGTVVTVDLSREKVGIE